MSITVAMRRPKRRSRGFTTVELIAVILIASTLAVSASAVLNRSNVETGARTAQLRALLDFAQKSAIASRRIVEVTVNATGGTVALRMCVNALRTATDCDPADANDWTTLRVPGSGTASYAVPTGISLETSLGVGTQVFTFDALGRPASAVAMPVPRTTAFTITQVPYGTSTGQTISIAPESGYVRM